MNGMLLFNLLLSLVSFLLMTQGCSDVSRFSGAPRSQEVPSEDAIPDESSLPVEESGTIEVVRTNGTEPTPMPTSRPKADETVVLEISLSPAVLKVRVKKDDEPEVECVASCTKTFPKGAVIKLAAIGQPATAPAARSFSRWQGGCPLTGAVDNQCSLKLVSNIKLTPVFKDKFTYYSGGKNEVGNLLRNSVYLHFNGVLKPDGLPPGTCTSAACDAVFIYNDEGSKKKICQARHPGSTPAESEFSVPSLAGWNGYYNLFIAQFVNSQWTRLCNGGTACYNGGSGPQYLTRLSCDLEKNP